ncbi:MAG: PAS-domain containing protein, partial [Pseudomonadota bacterium]
ILRYGISVGEYAIPPGEEEAWLAERLDVHRQAETMIEQPLSDGRWLRIVERAMPDGGRVGLRIGYDETLSHRIFAGADAIGVPSRFEPCGLTQLYGLAYGTLPIVALTGGLADTVVTANAAGLAKPVANGLNFHPVSADALRNALGTLATLYADRKLWTKLQRNAMSQPVDWTASAKRYAALYGDVTA